MNMPTRIENTTQNFLNMEKTLDPRNLPTVRYIKESFVTTTVGMTAIGGAYLAQHILPWQFFQGYKGPKLKIIFEKSIQKCPYIKIIHHLRGKISAGTQYFLPT